MEGDRGRKQIEYWISAKKKLAICWGIWPAPTAAGTGKPFCMALSLHRADPTPSEEDPEAPREEQTQETFPPANFVSNPPSFSLSSFSSLSSVRVSNQDEAPACWPGRGLAQSRYLLCQVCSPLDLSSGGGVQPITSLTLARAASLLSSNAKCECEQLGHIERRSGSVVWRIKLLTPG